jgi:serine/threonine protein phosphatase PrpC
MDSIEKRARSGNDPIIWRLRRFDSWSNSLAISDLYLGLQRYPLFYSDDKFLVVASDGLWEFISNEEVLEMVVPAFVRNNPE